MTPWDPRPGERPLEMTAPTTGTLPHPGLPGRTGPAHPPGATGGPGDADHPVPADGPAPRPDRSTAPRRSIDPVRLWRGCPWWARVLTVYGLARLGSAVLLLVAARTQVETVMTPQSPGYAHFVARMWDSNWYRGIAQDGYPDQLPIGLDGQPQQNAWAFFPLFPALARLLIWFTGQPWDVVAPGIALLAGAGAMLVIHRTIEVGCPLAVAARPGLPLATVAVVSTFPAAALLQTAYTEGLALLLVAVSLHLVVTRRYAWAAACLLLLGLTRAVALPMALVVLVHALGRRRAEDGLRPRTALALAGLGAVALVSGVLWQGICAWALGDASAYTRTQSAWRGGREVVPFLPWATAWQEIFGPRIWLLLVPAAIVIAVLVWSPGHRLLAPELQAWTVGYWLYLVAVVYPGSSVVRFALLAFPLGAAAVAIARSRWWVAGVILAGLGGQVVWVFTVWRFMPPMGWPP